MDSSTNTVIPYLFLATFVIALIVGVMQYRKARKAKDEHRRAASAVAKGEPYSNDAARATGKGGVLRD